MRLPDNAIKELLSRNFVRLVAARAGFVAASHDLDYGTDVSLHQVALVEEPSGATRYSDTGFVIGVQVKATCEGQVRRVGDAVHYDLASKNYNDIVRRADSPVPLVLALLVLPDDPSDWLSLSNSELTLRRHGYIWRPAPGSSLSSNKATEMIALEGTDLVEASTFDRLFDEMIA
jgi:hypothetical protein